MQIIPVPSGRRRRQSFTDGCRRVRTQALADASLGPTAEQLSVLPGRKRSGPRESGAPGTGLGTAGVPVAQAG